ncbi:dienelactone hydrolase family protein [Montanilutibacter psychrotolerans]|uniref:Dienelactone hydrolase family protein n=1 Tax=Montanilutibacter psychrotolerans TaxID=1327343 RepID=A0A3M8T5T8_9GAMM|nr:dienelactone hydrolase family protein [Lysobacter psychrotolerans]
MRTGTSFRFRRWLAGGALLLSAVPALAAMQTRPVTWTVGEDAFQGVLVYDDAGSAKRPGVVMVPNWMGVTDLAVERAKDVAGTDYVVLVADVYGRDARPADKTEARAQVAKAYADGGTTLRARAAAALAALKAQADNAPLDVARISAIGFCFGGSVVLELARGGADLAGVVSFHGGLKTHLPIAGNALRAPMLVLNGANDTSVPDADVQAFAQEMEAAGADWQFVDFGGAVHCFTQPEDAGSDPANNCRYDERASRRAFAMMRAFFTERFAAPAP